MKTSIKTLFATAFAAIILTSSAFAADARDNNFTQLNDVKSFNNINVSGNVELILVQSPVESVKVYDNYYAKNALVQQKNNDLFISSYEKEKLTVVVYVNNLIGLSASDNATVSTFGKLSLLSLNVTLKNNATADLNVNTLSLSSNVSGTSNLVLAGSTNDLNAKIEQVAVMNLDKFTAESTHFAAKNAVAKTNDADAFLFNLGK